AACGPRSGGRRGRAPARPLAGTRGHAGRSPSAAATGSRGGPGSRRKASPAPPPRPAWGGKTARATRARLVLEPLDAPLAEPSSPLADDLRVTAAADRDLLIGQALGRVEDQPGSRHDPKRGRGR